MKIKHFIVLAAAVFLAPELKAQVTNTDSATVAKTFAQLLGICKYIDFSDPNVTKLGTFYNAAPFIVYRGDDKKRAWKDFADYTQADEKTGVDEICARINNTVNQDENYKIVGYSTETESEGTWYVLMVSYVKNGVAKKSAFAFLKINGRFALGDID